MSERKTSSEESESVARWCSEELSRRYHAVNEALQQKNSPATEDLEAIERYSKLKGLLPTTDSRHRLLDVGVLLLIAFLVLICAFVRLPSTAVDLDIRATGVKVTLAGKRSELLIPGELGEILELNQARIYQAEQMLPPPDRKSVV